MRKWRTILLVTCLIGACGGDGAEDTIEDGTDATTGATVVETTEEPTVEQEVEVDSCSLITDEEASEMAGEELEAAEDSPLGCPYVVPGEVIGEFSIRGYVGSGDSSAAASDLVPSAVEVLQVPGIGDDAVVISSNGEVVDFIIARQGDRFIVMNTTFLFLEPETEDADRATTLAGVALQRLVDSG
jgi:hypothetical protein